MSDDEQSISNEELKERLLSEKGEKTESEQKSEEPDLLKVGYVVNSDTQSGSLVEYAKNKWPWLSMLTVAIFVLLVLWFLAWASSGLGLNEVSSHTIHWHAELKIIIKGEEVTIPPSVGLLNGENSVIHTHDPDNVIHLHNEGRVQERDVWLKRFFDVWDKDFSEDRIFDHRVPRDGTLRMYVNGVENFDFEHYPMRNGDVIEVILD